MNYNYNNYKVFIAPNEITWANTGAGAVSLEWAADIPSLDHTAAANTPVLEINIAKSIKKSLGLSGQNAMKINTISVGSIIGTAALTSAGTVEGHKLSVSSTTGLVTSAAVTLSGTIPKAISTGQLSVLTPSADLEIQAYDDFNLEITAVCAATSVLKITSLIVDVDILDL